MYPICVDMDTLQTYVKANYDRQADRQTEKVTYRGTTSALPKNSSVALHSEAENPKCGKCVDETFG